MALNERQQLAVNNCLKGHNMVICGQAGSGKTFTLKVILRAMRDRGKTVALTASTGIACTQFPENFRATTIHRWSGINDGRNNIGDLCHLIKTDEHYVAAQKRIKLCDVLILDEISMLSARLLGLLEGVCRGIRGDNRLFGGLQVILSGDFYQLPPVSDVMMEDNGEFAFRNHLWSAAFPHKVELIEVVRQTEPDLIQAVNELARGTPSQQTLNLISRMKRPLPPSDKPALRLFPTNLQVDTYNMDCVLRFETSRVSLASMYNSDVGFILEAEGEIHKYVAEDTGDTKKLKASKAPRVLVLKRRCPVILIRNLSDTLVNGTLGTVVDISSERPVVHFTKPDITMPMTRLSFSEFDLRLQKTVAERTQFPLKLAYSLTIHKSQGMSEERVHIDCNLINRPGQLGVAVGRATCKKGLRIVNFAVQQCVKQTPEIEEFYANESAPLDDSMQCCHGLPPEDDTQEEHDYPGNGGSKFDPEDGPQDDFENFEPDIMESIDAMLDDLHNDILGDVPDSLPQDFDIPEMLNKVKYEAPFTPLQTQANILVENLKSELEEVKMFLNKQAKIIAECLTEPAGDTYVQKELTVIYTAINKHQISTLYYMQCQRLMKTSNLSKEQKHICFRMFVYLREMLVGRISEDRVKEKAGSLSTALVSRSEPTDNLTAGGRGKIRYVGGYCFAKVRYHHQVTMRNRLYSTDLSSRTEVHTAQAKTMLLTGVCRSGPQSQQESADPGSLFEISRKQNVRGSLTDISDGAYEFFSNLCTELLSLQTVEHLNTEGKYLHASIVRQIQQNNALVAQWGMLFPNEIVLPSSTLSEYDIAKLVHELFNETVNLFSRVMINQFRKDLLGLLRPTKSKALRTEVTSAAGGSEKDKISLRKVVEDVSLYKYLKAAVEQKHEIPKELTKEDLKVLSQAFGLRLSYTDNKTDLQQKLIPIIIDKDAIPYPEKLSRPRASTSASCQYQTMQQASRKSARTSAKKRKKSEDMCHECQAEYQEGELWIQCDICDHWYHRECVEIFDDEEWESYEKEQFRCHNC